MTTLKERNIRSLFEFICKVRIPLHYIALRPYLILILYQRVGERRKLVDWHVSIVQLNYFKFLVKVV